MHTMLSKFSQLKKFRFKNLTLVVYFVIGLILSLHAQEKDSTNQFKTDFFKMYDSSSKKILELSGAIPFKDYDWRPVENVRSIKESLMHLAGTNYYLASKLNHPLPQGIDPKEFTKTAISKDSTIKILKISLDHIRAAIININNDQLYSLTDFWGEEETMQRIILQVGEHMAEHLGQLIVYSRIRGVTPPWSK